MKYLYAALIILVSSSVGFSQGSLDDLLKDITGANVKISNERSTFQNGKIKLIFDIRNESNEEFKAFEIKVFRANNDEEFKDSKILKNISVSKLKSKGKVTVNETIPFSSSTKFINVSLSLFDSELEDNFISIKVPSNGGGNSGGGNTGGNNNSGGGSTSSPGSKSVTIKADYGNYKSGREYCKDVELKVVYPKEVNYKEKAVIKFLPKGPTSPYSINWGSDPYFSNVNNKSISINGGSYEFTTSKLKENTTFEILHFGNSKPGGVGKSCRNSKPKSFTIKVKTEAESCGGDGLKINAPAEAVKGKFVDIEFKIPSHNGSDKLILYLDKPTRPDTRIQVKNGYKMSELVNEDMTFNFIKIVNKTKGCTIPINKVVKIKAINNSGGGNTGGSDPCEFTIQLNTDPSEVFKGDSFELNGKIQGGSPPFKLTMEVYKMESKEKSIEKYTLNSRDWTKTYTINEKTWFRPIEMTDAKNCTYDRNSGKQVDPKDNPNDGGNTGGNEVDPCEKPYTFSMNGTSSVKQGENAKINFKMSGGSPPYRIEWTEGLLTNIKSGHVVEITPPATKEYKVFRVEDSNGCMANKTNSTWTISVNELVPDLSFGNIPKAKEHFTAGEKIVVGGSVLNNGDTDEEATVEFVLREQGSTTNVAYIKRKYGVIKKGGEKDFKEELSIPNKTEEGKYVVFVEISKVAKEVNKDDNKHLLYLGIEADRFYQEGDLNTLTDESYTPTISNKNDGLGQAIYATWEEISWQTENTLNFSRLINRHSINLIGGYTAQEIRATFSDIEGKVLLRADNSLIIEAYKEYTIAQSEITAGLSLAAPVSWLVISRIQISRPS